MSLELVLADEGAALGVLAALGARWQVDGGDLVLADREFLDTYDGRLHAAGLTLERPVRTGDERMVLREADGIARPVDGPVRERLVAVLGVRSALPQARVRSRLRPLRLRNEDAKIVVRLAIEEPEVVTPRHDPVQLAHRLHVSGVRGYDKDLARVRKILEDDLALSAPKRRLVDESIRAAGGTPAGQSTKVDAKLRARDRADAAAIAVCRQMAAIAETTLPGTLADHDSEFLHDFRVAVRRTRSMLRELDGTLPAEEAAAAREHLRWVQAISGPTRDLDVLLLEWPELVAGLPARAARDLVPVRDVLARQRKDAFEQMHTDLRSAHFAIGWRAWRTLLERPLPEQSSDDRPKAAQPIAELAGHRIRSVYSHMTKRGSKIKDSSPAEDLHSLRKRGKELRYLLEVFGRMWPGKEVKPLIRTLKDLQDVLGRFQDREAQAEYLRGLGGDVAARPGGADAVLALGRLLDHLAADQQTARDEFAKQFAAFASKETRKGVAATFVVKQAKPAKR